MKLSHAGFDLSKNQRCFFKSSWNGWEKWRVWQAMSSQLLSSVRKHSQDNKTTCHPKSTFSVQQREATATCTGPRHSHDLPSCFLRHVFGQTWRGRENWIINIQSQGRDTATATHQHFLFAIPPSVWANHLFLEMHLLIFFFSSLAFLASVLLGVTQAFQWAVRRKVFDFQLEWASSLTLSSANGSLGDVRNLVKSKLQTEKWKPGLFKMVNSSWELARPSTKRENTNQESEKAFKCFITVASRWKKKFSTSLDEKPKKKAQEPVLIAMTVSL